MQAFNTQAGVALQNAKLFATVKQQEQRQKDILRSLTNGVISTDSAGHIIAANESAIVLLGLTEAQGATLEGQALSEFYPRQRLDQSFRSSVKRVKGQ